MAPTIRIVLACSQFFKQYLVWSVWSVRARRVKARPSLELLYLSS